MNSKSEIQFHPFITHTFNIISHYWYASKVHDTLMQSHLELKELQLGLSIAFFEDTVFVYVWFYKDETVSVS